MSETPNEESVRANAPQTLRDQPAPTFDVYQAEVDGVTVVHVCTDQLAEDANGPIIRIYLNDEPVFENPPFPVAEASPARNEATSHWDDDPEFPLSDWQHEVAEGNTRLGYHDWIACQREQ